MGQIARLASIAALETLGATAYTPAQKDLFVYQFDGGKHRQVLNEDASNNTRDVAVAPYFQNVLLKPTPSFYFGQPFHDAAEINQTHSAPYRKCKLHFANGWTYDPARFVGVYFRLWVKTDIGETTLVAFVDLYNGSRIVANTRELFLEGVGFSQSIEFDILDLDAILNNPAMSDIKTAIFGAATEFSELNADFEVIENEQLIEFQQGIYMYRRLAMHSVRTVSVGWTDTDSELSVSMNHDTVNKWIELRMLHSKYSIDGFMSKYITGDDQIDVNYDITLEHYDSNDDIIGSDAVQLRNLVDPTALIRWRPILGPAYDHTLIECRATIANTATGLRFTRYNSIIITNPGDAFEFLPFSINASELKVVNRITKVEQVISSPNELPSVVEIVKPIFVATAQNDVIVLHPYQTNVKILLNNIDTTIAKRLDLLIGGRKYSAAETTQDHVIFSIPSSEYYTEDTSYYISNEASSIVTFGRIARFEK